MKMYPILNLISYKYGIDSFTHKMSHFTEFIKFMGI